MINSAAIPKQNAMKTLGIKEIHNFISSELKDEIFERYIHYEILSEADLQAHIWQILFEYFRSKGKKGLFTIHNNHYHKELRNHPDLVVYRRDKPYIIIELKEWRTVNLNKWSTSKKRTAANKDIQRLLTAKKHFFEQHKIKVKRGYFMYVSWKPIILQEKGIKKEGARFLFPIHFVPDDFTFSNNGRKVFN